jgi:hypothetical protein
VPCYSVWISRLQAGATLAKNQDDNLGAFMGLFPAAGNWEGKLSQDEHDIAIVLAETRG